VLVQNFPNQCLQAVTPANVLDKCNKARSALIFYCWDKVGTAKESFIFSRFRLGVIINGGERKWYVSSFFGVNSCFWQAFFHFLWLSNLKYRLSWRSIVCFLNYLGIGLGYKRNLHLSD